MKTKLLLCATALAITLTVRGDDPVAAGQQAIRDKAGNIVGYKEQTVNNTRYRDANQNIVGTVDRVNKDAAGQKKQEPKK